MNLIDPLIILGERLKKQHREELEASRIKPKTLDNEMPSVVIEPLDTGEIDHFTSRKPKFVEDDDLAFFGIFR